MTPPRASLPVPPSRFVGRDDEMRRLGDLLRDPAVRLVTLTGVGGCGKTRLALEVVRHVAPTLQEQIAFIDLAPLRSAEQSAQLIAQALGLAREVSEAALADALRDHSGLVVLDNFEHLLGATGLVFALLTGCPGVRFLITSRTVLGMQGEHVFSVRPMPTDQGVQLFLDRAQAADSRFAISAEDAPVVTEICSRLDGLPLAIELAAARVRVLPPRSLLKRLESRLSVLTGGGRERPARHQALRNTIEWSYQLLDSANQVLFRRVAVLRGSWTLDEAASVVSETTIDALAGTEALVDGSLVEPASTPDAEPRFRMLETIREFALERLFASGEGDAAYRGLMLHLVDMCQSDVGSQRGAAQSTWFAQLDLELDNIRAALAWTSRATHDVELGLELATRLHHFWKEAGHWSEGRQWLERTLARAESADPVVLARGLTAAGDLAYLQGDTGAARDHLVQSVELWRQQGACVGLAQSLRLMARVSISDGQLPLARSLSEEALDIAAVSGARVETGLALNVMGMVQQGLGDLAGALLRYEEGLGIMRELGDLPGSAFILWEIGQVAELQGDLDRAAQAFQEGQAVGEQASDRKEIARCLLGLARVALRRDVDLDSAESLAVRSLDLFRAMGAEREIEQALAVVASIHDRRRGTFRVRARRSDGLTEREVQIVSLIADGASNAEIGRRLLLSIRTVERHIENIYAKLGVQGRTARAAVASYAVRAATTRNDLRVHTDAPDSTLA